MKTIAFPALILALALSSKTQAQDPCKHANIIRQVDSLKSVFQRNGFTVMQEASVSMESENELPVIVPMKMGTPYQVVFIGDAESQSYEVKMFDFNEKQVFHSKSNGREGETNIISYSYTPQMSEYHLISSSQLNTERKKNLCGYILLLKK